MSELVQADKNYELSDHLFRDQDHYAQGKYKITMRWLRSAGIPAGASLLNVGCGAGHFNQMADRAGFVVTGVEPEKATFDLAVRAANGSRVQVLHGDLGSVPAQQKFDVIVMHDVLEHIEDDLAAVKKLSTLLAPNGVLILSVPALPGLFGLHDENLGHFRRYTKGSLLRVLKTEFKVDHCRYYGFVFIPIVYLLSVVFRRPYPSGSVQDGWVNKVIRFLCWGEAWVPLPLGTSVIGRFLRISD